MLRLVSMLKGAEMDAWRENGAAQPIRLANGLCQSGELIDC
jgi:hypothetical protein